MDQARSFVPDIGTPLPRIRPEEAGVEAKWIEDMVDGFAAKGLRIHSFLLVKEGKVYAEGYYAPYGPKQFQTVYSLSKSFTSAAMGIAQGEGILNLDEKLVDIFADEVKAAGIEPSEKMRALTLRNCLRMSTGQAEEKRGVDFITTFLSNEQKEMPGEVFRYNTMATYMCSAALWKKGVDLEKYLQEKLFDPMGIHGLHWLRCSRGICTGGYGLSLLPEVIAKFGTLLLQDGQWEGKQLIPKEYLDLATTKQIDNAASSDNKDWKAGYGYQFWMCQNGSFRGDGMYGQLCVVNRQKKAVAAVTAFVDDIQAELDVYFDNVLSRMQPAPLPKDEAADQRLLAKLAALKAPVEQPFDDGGKLPVGLLDKEYRQGAHSLRLRADGQALLATLDGRELRVERGPLQETQCLATGGWLNVVSGWKTNAYTGYGVRDGALVLRLLFIEEMTDLRIVIWPDGRLEACNVYDINNPKPLAD